MLRLTIAHCFPFLDTSLNNLLLLGQSVTWHKSKHRLTVYRGHFRVLRAPLWRDSVWIGPPSLIHMNWNVKLMSSCATCWIDLSVASSQHLQWVSQHKIQPLADNFEVYMQKKTTAGALQPDSMTGGNIYMMLSIFVHLCLVYWLGRWRVIASGFCLELVHCLCVTS